MKKKRLFIFEYISGGGYSQIDIPISLFCEGFGMLKSIITDFYRLDFEISTILDYRIFLLSKYLPTNIIKKVESKEKFIRKFKTLVKNSTHVFIIAPETSNILYNLTKIVKNYKKILLSTNLEGIKIGTSKINTHDFFKTNKLVTPRTYLIPYKKKNLYVEFIIEKLYKLGTPIIIKPEDGVGAESIYYFETEDQIKAYFQQHKKFLDINRNYIIQQYVEGLDLSASLIGTHSSSNFSIESPLILSINSQTVNFKNLNHTSEYFGGYTPVKDAKNICFNLKNAIKFSNFSKFTGYFGIDFIKKGDFQLYFIEINPRLTTSYIGLRNVINQNPAKLILNSKLNIIDPLKIEYHNFSLFSRIELRSKNLISNKGLYEGTVAKLMKKIPEFVTPPISLNDSDHFSCFIATKTTDLESSKKRFKEITQYLAKLGFIILKPIEPML
ncbi:MAG: ATP-grasp domain-containing protein [Promethearchaeota archaeon]